jgi:hypothetical protein
MEKKEMGGSRSTMRETRGAYRVFVGRPEGRSLLGKPRLRWEMILNWILRSGLDWIYQTQNRNRGWGVVNAAMNLRIS